MLSNALKSFREDLFVYLIILSISIVACGYTAYSVFVDTVIPTGIPLRDALYMRWSNIEDISEYVKMVDGVTAIAPFRYRVLTPALANLMIRFSVLLPSVAVSRVAIFPLSAIEALLAVNFVFTLLTSFVFYHYLAMFRFSRMTRLVGVLLFLASFSVLLSSGIPFVDAAAYFFTLCALFAMRLHRRLASSLFICLGILNKEVMLISVFVFLFVFLDPVRIRASSSRAIYLLSTIAVGAVLPVIVFALVRFLMGGTALEVGYNWQITDPTWIVDMLNRFAAPSVLTFEIAGILLNFMFLWIGLIYLNRDRFLMRSGVIALPLTFASQLLLAGSVIRIIFMWFPILIPAFLFGLGETDLMDRKGL